MKFSIKEFVPTEKKINVITLSVEESMVDSICNPMILDMFFNLNMLLAYTDIAADENATIISLYDKYLQDGTLQEFLTEMKTNHKDEFESMKNYLLEYKLNFETYNSSFAATLNNVLDIISQFLKSDAEGLKNFDFSKLAQVLPLAEALGINLEKVKELPEKE